MKDKDRTFTETIDHDPPMSEIPRIWIHTHTSCFNESRCTGKYLTIEKPKDQIAKCINCSEANYPGFTVAKELQKIRTLKEPVPKSKISIVVRLILRLQMCPTHNLPSQIRN